jgi:hypothetical protein
MFFATVLYFRRNFLMYKFWQQITIKNYRAIIQFFKRRLFLGCAGFA